MRAVTANARCDWCPEEYEVELGDDEEALEEGMQAAGWYAVHHDGQDYDFCSLECLNMRLG